MSAPIFLFSYCLTFFCSRSLKTNMDVDVIVDVRYMLHIWDVEEMFYQFEFEILFAEYHIISGLSKG